MTKKQHKAQHGKFENLNLKNAAGIVSTFLHDCGFEKWAEFRKNPVHVFQLATVYNISQVIAGKDEMFPDAKLRPENGPNEKEYKHFLEVIHKNLKNPKESKEAAKLFVRAMCGALGNVAFAADYSVNPKSPKHTKEVFQETSELMSLFTSKLLADKHVGFDSIVNELGLKIVEHPTKGIIYATDLLEHYGLDK